MTGVLPALVGGTPTWMPNICLYDWLSIDKTPEPVDEGSNLGIKIQRLMDERVEGNVENDIVIATVKAFKNLGITCGKICFDDLRFEGYIKSQIPGIEVVDAYQILLDIRKVRTLMEIQLCAYSARVNQLALNAR